ncbi:MAG: histone deacetylase, partial [Thermoplasmata archaeon]
MTTHIVYSKEFHKHDNVDHLENARRLDAILNEIKQSSFSDDLVFVEPEMLPENSLYRVHTDRMIKLIKEKSTIGDSWIDPDTYICKNDYDVARLAAGGLVMVCKNVLSGEVDNAFVLARPPGHHATRDRSMGFCLFNNAALAAHEVTKTGKRVLIFDPDVHHGNGTQDIFYNRRDVMYQSFHLSPHYPGTGDIDEIGIADGTGFTINAPLIHGNGDNAVSQLLE